MAFRFDGSSQYGRTGSTPVSGVPITIAGWFNSDNETTSQAVIYLTNSSDNAQYIGLLAVGSHAENQVRALMRSTLGFPFLSANTTSGYTSGTWHHAACRFPDNDTAEVWLDGGNYGISTAATETPSGLNRLTIGHSENALGFSSQYFDGKLAEIGIWNTDLTDAEINSLSKGFSPLFVRPQNLVFYVPLVNTSISDDLVGNLDISWSGSPTNDEHCRILMPHHLMIGSGIASRVDNIPLFIEGHEKISTKRLFFSDSGADYDKIISTYTNGENESTLRSGLTLPRDVAFHSRDHYIYFIDDGSNNIQKMKFDGTDHSVIVSSLSQPIGIDVDYVNTPNKIYFSDLGTDLIKRADLNGDNEETIVDSSSGVQAPYGVALDLNNSKIYWVDNARILRADLNGDNVETLVTGENSAWGITIDTVNQKVYWTRTTNLVRRSNLDGSNVETVFDPSAGVYRNITFDTEEEFFYIADNGQDKIIRIDTNGIDYDIYNASGSLSILDGIDIGVQPLSLYMSGSAPSVTGVNDNVFLYTKGHEIIPHRKLYFHQIDLGDNGLYNCDLDKSDIPVLYDKLVDFNTDQSWGIDIDHTDGRKIYFTWLAGDKIERSDLDGSNIETLVTASSGVNGPKSIVFSAGLERIYWSEAYDPEIHYSDADGENVVDTNVDGVYITVDYGRSKLYFSPLSALIRQCDLDGSNPSDIAVPDGTLGGLIYCEKNDKIYWSDPDASTVYASGIDGGDQEVIIASGSISIPRGLYVDIIEDKLYIADLGQKTIYRCDCDGLNLEPLFPSGTIATYEIAVDNYQPSINLITHGYGAANNNILLFTHGSVIQNNNIDLFVVGTQGVNDNISLFIRGYQENNDNIELFIHGQEEETSTPTLFVKGHETIDDNVSLYTLAHNTLNNNIPLLVYGYTPLNNNLELFVGGLETINDNIPLSLVGHADYNNNIEFFIHSHQQVTDSITLLIRSLDQTIDNIPLFIWGHDRVLRQKLYTLDSANGDILISDLDGSLLAILLENNFVNALGIDVDQVNGKIYWTENINNNISRANLDGTGAEIIVPTASGVNGPGAISVRPILNRIYWIDGNGNNLKRANLDGTNVETLI